MNQHTTSLSADVTEVLRRELLMLAKLQEDTAAAEAARVPYWRCLPASVEGHRLAAAALRADAARLRPVW
jgi:hypothetical protein